MECTHYECPAKCRKSATVWMQKDNMESSGRAESMVDI